MYTKLTQGPSRNISIGNNIAGRSILLISIGNSIAGRSILLISLGNSIAGKKYNGKKYIVDIKRK